MTKLELIANVRRRMTTEQQAAIEKLSKEILKRLGASVGADQSERLVRKILQEQGSIEFVNQAAPTWIGENIH